MSFFRWVWCLWKYRDVAWDEMVLQHYMLVKSARRCAHDLDHAVDQIPEDCPFRLMFSDRCRHWKSVFSLNGIKDYRVEIVKENEWLKEENRRLEDRISYYESEDGRRTF